MGIILLALILLALAYLIGSSLDSEEQKIQDRKLILNTQVITDDISNTCYSVSKELKTKFTFQENLIYLVKKTASDSAFWYRHSILVKDDFDEDELLYIIKNLEIEFQKRVNQHYHLYSNKEQNLKLLFEFNKSISRRQDLHYIDLDIRFYYNDDDLMLLQ